MQCFEYVYGFLVDVVEFGEGVYEYWEEYYEVGYDEFWYYVEVECYDQCGGDCDDGGYYYDDYEGYDCLFDDLEFCYYYSKDEFGEDVGGGVDYDFEQCYEEV